MDRRDFLKAGGILWVGTAGTLGLRLLSASESATSSEPSTAAGHKWGMVIDLNKCSSDCNACLKACRTQNNVAFFGDKRWDIHWIRKVTIKRKHAADSVERSVPLLCNHCENPPCAQVCPVQATYKRDDGIVICDSHRCIGCRYCVVACPYNARYFNYKENPEWPNKAYTKRSHGVTEACNFCAPLLDAGGRPKCVEVCEQIGARALIFGDLNDPSSEVSRLVSSGSARGLREDLGTRPKVLYIGL